MARIKINEDFSEFLRLCLLHELRFMVIGGYAVVHYSRPRYTGDIDLWVDSSQENAERVVEILRDFGFPGEDVTTEMITGEREIIRLGFEPTRIELITRIPGVVFAECFERRASARIGSMDIPFIGLEDLKVNKKASGRHKDLQDLEELP